MEMFSNSTRYSLVSLKGTFSWITLLLCFTCLFSSDWHRLSCCWLQREIEEVLSCSQHAFQVCVIQFKNAMCRNVYCKICIMALRKCIMYISCICQSQFNTHIDMVTYSYYAEQCYRRIKSFKLRIKCIFTSLLFAFCTLLLLVPEFVLSPVKTGGKKIIF